MRKELWCWLVTISSLQQIHGHGRMEEPPARNAAWRYGFDVPVNYDDVGLNCGGLSIQRANDGKCGVCGDAYTGPKYHEIGGKYATNVIVRQYATGAMIDVKILITANHIGFMELRLCPATDPTVEVTQECLDEHVLELEGFGKQFPIQEGMDSVLLKAHLPDELSCSRCVLQWRYHAGNSWGTNRETGQSCLGCGLQEEFYNCADISISSREIDLIHSHEPENSLLDFPLMQSNAWASHYEHSPMSIHRTTTPTSSSSSSTEAMDFPYPYRPSNAIFEEHSPKERILHCYPTNEVLKPVVGIEKWCEQLCLTECPPTLCVCVRISI